VLEEDEEDGAGGQEALDIDEIQQVGGVSLKDGRESGRRGEGGGTAGRGNGFRQKKAEGEWGQQEDQWAERGGGGGEGASYTVFQLYNHY